MRFSRPLFTASVHAAGEVLKLERPADAVLSAFFRNHPQIGQNDRVTVAETVFGILRRKRQIEYLCAPKSASEYVLGCWALVLGANQRELEALAPARTLETLVEAKDRSSNSMRDSMPLAVACDMPDWLVERLLPRLGEEGLRSLAAGLLQGAPLDLRVNVLKISREDALAQLSASGFAARPTPYSPFGLRVQGKPAINRHPLFLQGCLEVQDEGSQLLCVLLGARRGEMVADFCAGAGGKTLALGMMMRSTGRLYAYDVSEPRLSKLKPRLARSGLSNVHAQRIEGERDIRLSRLAGKMDRVLVDAPCSGLGTLRRNPDLKWRHTPAAIEEMRVKQTAILLAASRLVKPGGRLVYATCSLLEEENRSVVEEFLAGGAPFALQPAGAVLAADGIRIEADPYLELFPQVHGTDGFFAALFERAQR